MAYRRVGVTKSEMLELRKQGLSNKDIANVLEISEPTVYRYIGGQGKRMESMAAFKEKKTEEIPVEPKEIKRAVDEVVVRTERLSSKNGNTIADVDYMYHTVEMDVGTLSFDELEDFAVFVVGMVERIKKAVKK